MARDRNRCPTHPGVFLNKMVLPHVDASKTEIAKGLAMSRQHLHAILKGKQPITPATAVRLERLVGRSADAWLNMQTAYDVWFARRELERRDPKAKEERISA